jgi:hypothetical protein
MHDFKQLNKLIQGNLVDTLYKFEIDLPKFVSILDTWPKLLTLNPKSLGSSKQSKFWRNNHFQLGPSLSGFLDKFASFTRSVYQTNVLNLFYMRKKP